MPNKVFSGILMALLIIGMLTLAFRIQPVKAQPTIIIVPDDYPTIQAAINAANAGDTVYVRNGIYQEHIEINKTITLTGESSQNTIIRANAFGWQWCGINITANDVTVENFNITGVGSLGSGVIYVGGSGYSDNVIKNNNIASAGNVAGDTLDIWSSNGNIVEGNRILVGNSSSAGIGVMSNDNMVCNNTVVGGWTCITVIVGDANNVSNNYVTGQTLSGGFSDVGAIDLTETWGDAVVGNTLINNELGLSVDSGRSCSVYHNNFINNTQQTLTEAGSQIAFDNDYPSGGNYWSDYNGTDSYSGPYQNVTGSDGIGDTPYVIDSNNTDRYPLMTHLAVHDVAVTDVTPSKTVVGQGFSASINVTVANQGDYTETFNVATYITTPPPLPLEIVINITTVSLDAGNNITISLAWNTTGWKIGNWRVSATTGYNTLSCTILITIPGDINGDFQVSLSDLVLLANAYGSKPSDAKWNPNADINGNNVVDLSDLVLMANHYGQHYP